MNWYPVSGANALSYDPGALNTAIYVKMAVNSNGVTAFSNVISIGIAIASNSPGKDTLLAGSSPIVAIPGYNSGDSLNFIKTRIITKPGVSDTVTSDGLIGAYDAHQTTQYYDGLGRSMQTVDKQASPTQTDMISTEFYDGFGRVVQKYLPYSDNQSTGTFRTDAAVQQPAFYNTYFNNKENYYYSNTTYESSALDRKIGRASCRERV